MTIDPEALRAWSFPNVVQRYDKPDAILYALGLGIGQDPLDPMQLQFVHEDGLKTLPTMAAVLGFPGPWLGDPATGVDYTRVVHGEQHIEVVRPLSTTATMRCVNRIIGVADRGTDKGAAITVARELYDDADGALVSFQTSVLIALGDGGFMPGAGDPGTRATGPRLNSPPTRDADLRFDWPVPQQSALIYRLTGDRNPLHAIPEVARRAGFDRPILHGLASFGISAFAGTVALCDGYPDRLRAIGVRFSAPVLPGETLCFEFWRVAQGEAAFRVRAAERDRVVLDKGFIRYASND